ncbi:Lactonase, 7-bladed beta-propeller-domain-containing protein [Syncephalastrum racemosum]|uniref:Lactonase, 7-bladed beta-propeller-domain-containing protein n=1 Tax=Syncephalastrum racemosum TaxID=13706 RepID=A0A1X2HPY4_SYNRA|nr:Lactonase, 7-bladed beta-propeller-domain-containing protein [Syncephalastrum racemosum]
MKISAITVLGGFISAAAAAVIDTAASRASSSMIPIFVSGYTDKGGKGIYSYSFENGNLTGGRLIAESDSPSWILVDHNTIYATNEVSEGYVTTLEKQGENWTVVDKTSSGGSGPVQLALQKQKQTLWAANYNDGTVGALDLKKNKTQAYQPPKSASMGVPDRQESPHAHSVLLVEDDKLVGTCDLGSDTVYMRDTRSREIVHSYTFKNGTGPRHLAATPDHVYVLSELTNQVFVLSKDLKELKQTLDALPSDFTGEDTGGEIVIHRDFLYASLRGYDGIATFRIGADGLLSLVGHDSCGGNHPRHFSTHGDYMIVANMNSNNLVVFKILSNGRIEKLQSIEHPQPTCVQWGRA